MNIKPRQIPKFDTGGKPSTVNWTDPNSTWFTRSGNQILETTFNTLKSLRDKWKASGSQEDYKKFKQYVDDLNNNQRYGYAPGHLHYKQGNNQLFIGRGTDAWQNMVRNNYKYINDAIGNNYSKYHVVSNLPNSGDSAKSNWKVDNYWAGETDDRTTWGNLLNPNDPDYLKWKDKFREIGIDYRTNPSWNNGDELYGFLIEDNPLQNKKIQPNNQTLSKQTDIRGREEFGNKQQNNSLNQLRKYLPNLLGTARLIGNLWNNDRVYKETLKGYNPNLKDSYKTHRIVVGDEAGKQQFYNRAAQGETKAGRAVTSNMDTQLAYQMENKRVGDELRRQGDIIDNQEIRRTSDEDMQHQFANAQRATEIANYNREAINAYKRDIHDLKAAKMSADWTSIDNELLARETRLRQRDLNNEQIREQLALLDYQNELNNDTEYQDANDELNDAIRDAKARNVDIKSDPKVKEAYNKLQTIQYQRKRRYLENSIYYAKKGTKITTKRKDDLLYKTAKDNGDHYRKMIKLTSDARKRKRITIDKLTSHPKGNTRKMQQGGVAPFTIYRPAVVGGEQSVSTRSSSSDSSKKDVTSYEFVKDLFKEMKGRGNPSDMNSIYIKVKNFLDEQSLFGNEITPDDMATFFISIDEELNQTDSLKAKSDKAKELAINNDALNEYAVTSNGELVVQDQSGKIKTSRASLQEIFEQGYTPLTNEQLSNFRVYHPEYAGRVDFDAIVANGVGMSKIASHIKSIIPAIKSNQMKEDNYVSNKLNQGIKALQEAPPGEYKQTITQKSNLEQAQYALNYIKGMLPKNMVKVLSINAQERGISPDQLIASLISSGSEVEQSVEYTAVTGKGAKDGTGSSGSDGGNDMIPAIAFFNGLGEKETFIIQDKTQDGLKINVISAPITSKGSNTGSITFDKLQASDFGGQLNMNQATMGDALISSTGRQNIVIDGRIYQAELPIDQNAKNNEGIIKPDLRFLKNIEAADMELRSLGIDKSDPNSISKINEIYRKHNLPILYTISNNKLTITSEYARFAIVNGIGTEDAFGDNPEFNDAIQEVSSDNERKQFEQFMQSNTNNSKYKLDNGYSLFGMNWGETKLYKGTIYIPMVSSNISALGGTGYKAKGEEYNQIEAAQQAADAARKMGFNPAGDASNL